MAEIMFDDQKTRIVLLNRSFGKAGREMKELRVRLSEEGAMFFHITQDAAPKYYGLSTAEADAFCEQWLEYRAEQKAKEQTEKERKQHIIAEAYAIVARHPEIKIETDGTASPTWWRVSIPSQDVLFRRPARYPEQLLEQVKESLALLQDEDTKATA
jgi:hypothetical protein